ncbi:MAG: hypothetical protein IT196_12540 [Acidimicrobiales bacterium]|nr:hypothetical protein [Acidimicrobiales bacterium]
MEAAYEHTVCCRRRRIAAALAFSLVGGLVSLAASINPLPVRAMGAAAPRGESTPDGRRDA